MFLDWILGLFSEDLAIDLGTANTLVYARDRGIISIEPSVVAIYKDPNGGRRVLAVGKEAKEMLGRTPGDVVAIRPLREGVISDFETTERMLRHLISVAHNRRRLVRPRVVVVISYGVTEVEKRAVKESAEFAGAREVYLVEEPIAAAIGAKLPITEPRGNMVVNIGGGTTEVTVISLAGIVVCNSVRVAGDKMDEAIVHYMKRKYSLLVSETIGEQIKIALGNAYPDGEVRTMEVRGRDLVTGLPRTIAIDSNEVREALAEPVNTIVANVLNTLEKTPPELSADIVDRGIVLTGGGSLLGNLDLLLHEVTSLPVIRAEDPICSVVLGAGKVLEELELLKEVAVS